MTQRKAEDGHWETPQDMVDQLQEVFQMLVNGEIDAETAHALVRNGMCAVKSWQLRLEHAKITKRMKEGSDHLPNMRVRGKQ
jgi:hypothetical protein